jgi:hypothetical protein
MKIVTHRQLQHTMASLIMTLPPNDNDEWCYSKHLNVDVITVLATTQLWWKVRIEQNVLHCFTQCAASNNMFKWNVQQSPRQQIFDIRFETRRCFIVNVCRLYSWNIPLGRSKQSAREWHFNGTHQLITTYWETTSALSDEAKLYYCAVKWLV